MKYIILLLIANISTNFIHATTPIYMPGFPDYQPITINQIEISTGNVYPDVNSTGFVEMKVSGRDYTDDLSKLDTIRQDEYYKKIPNDIMRGTPKYEQRYNIELEGNLDEDTEVKYNIQKEPDFPGIYNVYIRKKTTELQFGDFNTTYLSGDFINIEKYLNGVETNTIQDNWKGKATLGKEKSEPQKFETFGNDSKKYSLGKSFILEGSVIVYLNNQKLTENKDYTVNYYEGSITFNQRITKIDFIKVIYEFTNPIQDFIPSLSRKNFTGANYTYNPSQNILIDELIIVSRNETIIIKDQNQVLSNRIELQKSPIKLGSESVYLNSKLLTRGVHYFIKNNSGLVRFVTKQLAFNDTISVDYQYYDSNTETEILFGNGSPGPYPIKHKYISSDSLSVKVGGIEAREFIDYIYRKSSNTLLFYYKINRKKAIEISYNYKLFKEKNVEFKDTPFSVSLTYIDESTSVRENLSTNRESYDILQVEGENNNILVLQDNPIDQSKPLNIEINGETIDSSEYTVNYYEGKVTLLNLNNISANNVKVNYHYINSLNSEHSIKGLSLQSYNQDRIQFRSLPIKFNGIQKITLFSPNEVILEENRDFTIDYINNGEEFTDILVNFIIGGYSILNRYPSGSDIIKFNYQYTPSIQDTKTSSTHTMTDIRIKKELSKEWDIYTEIANTKYNFSKTSEYKKETFTTQQQNNIYQLQSSPIEENSELVFINGFSQTKDIDYYINYEKGEVTFINKTIPNNQKVEISYNFFASDTPNKKDVNAYSIESQYSPNKQFNMINKYNIVDPNFLPIGNININKGSSKFWNEINWKMNQNDSTSFIYEKEDIRNTKYDKIYKKNSYLTKINFNALIFETSHQILYSDIVSTQNYKENTSKIVKYENNIDYSFSNDKISLANSYSQENKKITDDVTNRSLLGGSKLTYINNFNVPNWIESGNISPYYSLNLDKTNSTDILSYNTKRIENIGFNSTTNFNSRFYSTTNFDKGTYFTFFPSNQSFHDTYYNYSHISNISPYNWINTNITISHEETISPIPGQEDKVEDRHGYNIIQLANDAALEYLNAPSYMISPFKGSFSNLGYLKTKKRENNTFKNYNEDRYFGTLNALNPLEGLLIPSTKFDASKSFLIDNQQTSYQKKNSSDTSFYSVTTGFTYKPNAIHFNRLSFDGSLNQSKSSLFSTLLLTSGTENITTTDIANDQQKYGVNINLPSIPLIITSISSPVLRLETSWTNKTEENKTSSNDLNNVNYIINNSFVSANIYQLNYSIFKKIKLKNSALDEKSFYNRNKISTSKGSLFRKKQNLDQTISYPFWGLFKNTEYLKYEAIRQYKNNEINIFQDSLQNNFNNALILDERLANHKTEIFLSSFLSLKGELEYQDFTQTTTSENVSTNDFLNQNSATSGLSIYPFSGFTILYDYSIKQLRQNNSAALVGNRDLLKVTYNPIKYENFELQLNISREKNWGFGFNNIQKEQLLQTSNESLSIEVVSRNDEVYLGSLNMNIIMPINNSEHIEKIIFSGEAYYKKIIDRIDTNNEIMINGMLFNTRIEL